jgi:hypothetical protein
MRSWLVLPHTLRIEGAVFLILLAQGHLPAVFALHAVSLTQLRRHASVPPLQVQRPELIH